MIASESGYDVIMERKNQNKANVFSNLFAGLAASVGVFGTWAIIAIVFLGDLYFFYLGFKFDSPWMIAMSFLIWPLVGPLGAWCFVFGVPLWMMNMLG